MLTLDKDQSLLKFYRDSSLAGLPGGVNPNGTKLETWLRLAGIPYETVIMSIMEQREIAPHGRVPFVELDGEFIGDETIIIEGLSAVHNDPLNDARLTRAQHATGGLIMSMCEHELFPIFGHGRFPGGDYKTWCEDYLLNGHLPEDEAQKDAIIEEYLQWVVKVLENFRIGNHDTDFINQQMRKCMEILSFSLGDGPWLFGDDPSVYDCSLFGFMCSVVHYPVAHNPQVQISREFNNIVEYCDRIRKLVYDYEPERQDPS